MREFSSTEGYLLVRVWQLFSQSDYEPPSGELEFMEEVQRACHDAVHTLDVWIDWDNVVTVFDYEYADESGPKSLARLIFDVVTDDESPDLDERVIAWLRTADLPLHGPPS